MALRYAGEAAEALPDDSDMQCLLAAAQLQNAFDRGDVGAMADASARLIELDPLDPTGHYYAGRAAIYQEKWTEAERHLLKAQELGWAEPITDKAAETAPGDDLLYLLAYARIPIANERGDVEGLTEASAQMIELAPTDPAGYYYAGLAAI